MSAPVLTAAHPPRGHHHPHPCVCRRYGLIGPNGCGKSCLLKALGARDVAIPDHIDVYLLDKEMAANDMTALQVRRQPDWTGCGRLGGLLYWLYWLAGDGSPAGLRSAARDLRALELRCGVQGSWWRAGQQAAAGCRLPAVARGCLPRCWVAWASC